MNKDSRITIGLALLYFLNGFINLLGPSKTFAPLVFIDSFLLALISLVFVALPPFKKSHLLFLFFVLHFVLQGCFNTNVFQHLHLDIANQFLLLFLGIAFYAYAVWSAQTFRWLLLVPALLFVATIFLRYIEAHRLVILAVALFLGLWQVYLLARPAVAESLSVLVRRFYLLMALTVFFDALYQLFLYLNFSQHSL